MKKSTAFLLTLGITSLVIGGIGASVYYKRAEETYLARSTESYDLKKAKDPKALTLNISGNTDVHLSFTNKNTISKDSSMNVTDTNFEVTEQDKQVAIDVGGESQSLKVSFFPFDIFYNMSIQTFIEIPSSVESITINGTQMNSVDISDYTSKDLKLTSTNASVVLSSVHLDKLIAKTKQTRFVLNDDTTIDDISISSEKSTVDLAEIATKKLEVKGKDTDIYATKIKGELSLETTNDIVSISDITGTAKIKTENGDVEVHGDKVIKDLSITTDYGDITISPYEILYDILIEAESENGDVSIYDESRNTYQEGNRKNKYKLTSTYGNIVVTGPYSYEE